MLRAAFASGGILMTVALLFALLQAGQPVPPPVVVPVIAAPMPPAPPPMIRTTVSPPPVVVPSYPPPFSPASRMIGPPVLVDVRVTAGNQTLFADQMRVDGMMGASYSQTRSEAMARVCPDARYDRQQSTNFNLRLNGRNMEAGSRQMSVSVNWSRPIESADCASNGTRGASINQTVNWEPGKTVVLTGDGGLRVELRPR
jgi:hypothetical protein